MRIGNIKTLIMGAMLLGGGTSVISSCGYRYGDEALKEYLVEKDVTQKEYDNIVKCVQRGHEEKTVAASQAFLDSMAYRDLFNQTKLAQDSSAVAAYNNLARIKTENYFIKKDPFDEKNISGVKNAFRNELIKNNYKISVFNNYMDNFPGRRFFVRHPFAGENQPRSCYMDLAQYYTDKYYYEKFFEAQGLMNDSSFKEKFEEVTEKIRPN